MKCPFCELDKSKIYNTILDESKYFYITPTLGSLVDGYILIISKSHINSMSLLTKEERLDYKLLIDKYRNIFKKIYGKYPIVFEHGSPNLDDKNNNWIFIVAGVAVLVVVIVAIIVIVLKKKK